MKVVVQRVLNASVKRISDGKIVGSIGKGYFILLGVGKEDNLEDAERLSLKILKLRVMSDSSSKMNLSLEESCGEILVVSQFTLLANTSSGNRPSFINAAPGKKAEEIYSFFVNKLKKSGLKVECGSFGEYMEINVKLDGPVTIVY